MPQSATASAVVLFLCHRLVVRLFLCRCGSIPQDGVSVLGTYATVHRYMYMCLAPICTSVDTSVHKYKRRCKMPQADGDIGRKPTKRLRSLPYCGFRQDSGYKAINDSSDPMWYGKTVEERDGNSSYRR